MRTILLVVLLALVGPGALSLAQVPESERIPITDPDLLESMGFPRDAKRVYRAKAIDAGPPPEAPEDWGAGTHFTAVTPQEIAGFSSSESSPYEWVTALYGSWGHVCLGGNTVVGARIHLPTGVRIEAVRWWAYDAAPADLDIAVLEVCHPPFGAGEAVVTQVAVGGTAGSAGHQSDVLMGSGYTVNNRDCYYMVHLVFGAYEDLEFGKLRIQWSRQISPPPGVASFGDVPTGHQFFQHIEALAASGITAGCGNGNFCPNNPVTRGQMAVFLSIALGLYFP